MYRRLLSRGSLSRCLLFVFAAVFAAPFLYGLFNLDGIFSARMIVIVFFAMPIMSSLTILLALRSKLATRAKLILMFVSCLVGLYMAEILLPFFGGLAARTPSDGATEQKASLAGPTHAGRGV